MDRKIQGPTGIEGDALLVLPGVRGILRLLPLVVRSGVDIDSNERLRWWELSEDGGV